MSDIDETAQPRLRAFLDSLPPTIAMFGVWYAVMLHLTWAGLLLSSDEPKHVTGVYALAQLFPAKTGLAIILIIVAGCATYGIMGRDLRGRSRVFLIFWQQIILGVSAFGAIRAMWLGHFADGAIRSHQFLVADQIPQVIALVVHSASIVYVGRKARW